MTGKDMKLNTLKKLLYGVFVSLVMVMMMLLSSCGSPSTLEEAITDDTVGQAAIETIEEELGDGGEVTVSGNNITASYTVSSTYSSLQISILQEQFESMIETYDDTLQAIPDNLQEYYGISGITFTIVYYDASGTEIFSKTYTASSDE